MMKNLLLIGIVLFGLASCESPIKNGDLIYLSLREGKNLSLNSDGSFKCSNEEKTPLLFLEQKDGSVKLKTEEGSGIVINGYFLYSREKDPTVFMLDTITDKIFLMTKDNRYLSCNGDEVYSTNKTDKPYVYISKY